MAGNLIQTKSRKGMMLEVIGQLLELDPEDLADNQILASVFNVLSPFGRLAFHNKASNHFDIVHGQACARCGTDLDDDGECKAETCPFSKCEQDDAAGWAGHPNPPEWVRK